MAVDMSIKRTRFIGKVHSLNQEFYFSSATVRSKLYDLYCCSYYGSNLYDLFNRNCEKIYKSFNVAIRICFNVPRETHKYFIQQLIEYPHPKIMLASRFVKFSENIRSCDKESVRVLSNLCLGDTKTVFRRNLSNIARECHTNIENLSVYTVKSAMKYAPVPDNEFWRIPLLHNLLAVRGHDWTVDNFDNGELNQMIYNVCTT